MFDPEIPFCKILVATDFSETAAAALETGVALARRWHAKLTVVHVVRNVVDSAAVIGYGADWEPTMQDLARLQKNLCSEAEAHMESTLAPYRTGELAIQGEIRVGRPYQEVVQMTNKHGCDLVIVGTRGRSSIRRAFVGSTATKLSRVCPCPLWVARVEHAGGLRSILVPLDFSEASEKALSAAVALAASTGAKLHVMHVYDTEDLHGLLPQSEETKAELAHYRRRARRAALERLQQSLARAVGSRALEVTSHVAQGTAWKVISAAAKRLGADLIVMGSVGRRGVPGLLIGNTAERVLHASDSSLLVIKPESFPSPLVRMAAVESRRDAAPEIVATAGERN